MDIFHLNQGSNQAPNGIQIPCSPYLSFWISFILQNLSICFACLGCTFFHFSEFQRLLKSCLLSSPQFYWWRNLRLRCPLNMHSFFFVLVGFYIAPTLLRLYCNFPALLVQEDLRCPSVSGQVLSYFPLRQYVFQILSKLIETLSEGRWQFKQTTIYSAE